MSDAEHFRQCLASSTHIETIAALMHQSGIDMAMAASETPGGVPYVAVVVQGAHSQLAEEWAEALWIYIQRIRRDLQDEAERG